MPCNSEYMEATVYEKELSKVACLLEELSTGKMVDSRSQSWNGYHPAVYNMRLSKEARDSMVKSLCMLIDEVLQRGQPLTAFSLELQIWWRDHVEADKKRKELDRIQKNRQKLRDEALSKLNSEEIRALGIEL